MGGQLFHEWRETIITRCEALKGRRETLVAMARETRLDSIVDVQERKKDAVRHGRERERERGGGGYSFFCLLSSFFTQTLTFRNIFFFFFFFFLYVQMRWDAAEKWQLRRASGESPRSKPTRKLKAGGGGGGLLSRILGSASGGTATSDGGGGAAATQSEERAASKEAEPDWILKLRALELEHPTHPWEAMLAEDEAPHPVWWWSSGIGSSWTPYSCEAQDKLNGAFTKMKKQGQGSAQCEVVSSGNTYHITFDAHGKGTQNSAVTHGSRHVKRTMETDEAYLCGNCGIQNQSGIVCYMCGYNKVLRTKSRTGGAQGP